MCWGKGQREQIPLCEPESRDGVVGGTALGRRVGGRQFRRSSGGR